MSLVPKKECIQITKINIMFIMHFDLGGRATLKMRPIVSECHSNGENIA
jgi:hypothetical protein